VRVDWANPSAAASEIKIEYTDFGGAWRAAGLFKVHTHALGELIVSEHRLSNDLGAHRLWRLVITGVPERGDVAIREVRFTASDPD
jgi:hypothetical protein